MSEALALLAALTVTGALTAWASRIFFGDYREGFRMLYHWTSPPDVSMPGDVEPRESNRGNIVQIAFVVAFVLLAILSFTAFLPLLRHAFG